MIQIIAGLKGSGKTKRLLDMTNTAAKESDASIVFVDDDNRYMYDIDHRVRFITADEYHIHTPEMFVGFICGMISQNFDIRTIFIDAFMKIAKVNLDQSEWLFKSLEELSANHGVNFVLSVSADPETMPGFLKAYII